MVVAFTQASSPPNKLNPLQPAWTNHEQATVSKSCVSCVGINLPEAQVVSINLAGPNSESIVHPFLHIIIIIIIV
jgi:hypothetical protein